jgi:glutaconate CoA-transferase, subunit B
VTAPQRTDPQVDYTPDELTTVVASRALQDGDTCFVGIGAPSAACNLARLTHAPNLVLIYESGTLQTKPEVLPLSIGDGELCETALTTVPVVEMFQYWLQGGRISKGFLGGAQIDRFANINTTVIGPYDDPKVRLPGGGGAPEIAGSCHEVLITAKHSRRTFVEQVDFVTSLGHGTGRGDRQRFGLTTAGPVLVITDLCLFEPDPETAELTVTSLHPGVTRERVREATGWAVRFAEQVAETAPPTPGELEVLRELQARTARAHAGE